MKNLKISLTILFFAIINSANSQVRIVNSSSNSSASNSSAFIDASSNSTSNATTNIGKGLLYPRVDLTTFASFSGSPTGIGTSYPTRFDGMVVYNTGTGNTLSSASTTIVAVTPGFYYYNNKSNTLTGGVWKPVGENAVKFKDGTTTADAVFTGGKVGIGTTSPSASAALEVNSTTSGILISRMTSTQRGLITSPANGLLIFNTSNNSFEVFKSTCSCWVTMNDNGNTAAASLVNNVPAVSNINYKGNYRAGGTANVVYTYSDPENDAEGATTIIWEIANDGNGTARTTLSTSATPTFVTANAGKYVRVKITPRAATGLLNGIDYYGGWNLIEAATMPYGSAVSLTGNTEQGSLLTGSYTFNGGTGIENTILGSTFNWQSATSNKGANTSTMAIPVDVLAFGKTIKPTVAEVNRFIRFGVRARDNASIVATNFVYSDWIGPITLAPETAPTATNVTLSQAPNTGLEIKGLYTYNDINNDPEDSSVYQWYTATDNQGANKTAISGAKSQSLLIDNSKIGSNIGFGVTPKALTGNKTGTEVVYFNSTATSLSVPLASNVSFSGTQSTGLVGNTLTGTYTYTANGSTGTEGSTLLKWYTANNASDAGTLVATGITYSPTSVDFGKYIIFEVTPVSSTSVTGQATRISRYAGTQILDFTAQVVQAAYSLRKLKATYTGNAIQVRRSSDNTTSEIGFTSTGLLDEAAVTSFVTNNGANLTANGFVSIWYDQSGNRRNVTNATTSQQPRIVTSGVLEKYNGVPTVQFVKASSTRLFYTLSTPIYVSAAMAIFAYKTGTSTYTGYDGIITGTTTSYALGVEGGTTNVTLSSSSTNNYKNKIKLTVANNKFDNGSITSLNALYVESTTNLSSANQWRDGILLGDDRNLGARNFDGPISEVILFEQNFIDNNYIDVLKIQDAQIMYYLGK